MLAFAVLRGAVSDQPAARVELDDAAVRACETFEPVASGVQSGELTGPPLFRALQDVYNEARLSQAEGFADQVMQLLNAAINEDQQAVRQDVIELQLTCQTRRG